MSNRTEAILGSIFLIMAALIAGNLFWVTDRLNQEHHTLAKHVQCNEELLLVLQKRGEARAVVDAETLKAQAALSEFLNEILVSGHVQVGDPHLKAVLDTYPKIAAARMNPALTAPYPDCGIG